MHISRDKIEQNFDPFPRILAPTDRCEHAAPHGKNDRWNYQFCQGMKAKHTIPVFQTKESQNEYYTTVPVVLLIGRSRP